MQTPATAAHTPIEALRLSERAQHTGGRLRQGEPGQWWLCNAQAQVRLRLEDARGDAPADGALARVCGVFEGDALRARSLSVVHTPGRAVAADRALGAAVSARDRLNRRARAFFTREGFEEVRTPCLVPSAGTDVYLDALPITVGANHNPSGALHGALHTSPEFAMKRMLTAGLERIYQLAPAWRDGEATERHAPEFTILEWYRAWAPMEAIVDDVEALVRLLLDGSARLGVGPQPREIMLPARFERVTMRELVWQTCGFDLLDALSFERLSAACERQLGGLPARVSRWDELFFALQVSRLDPWLEARGAVFVTDWPAPLAVLAKRDPRDPRLARRFELYIGGLELANGFEELTDAAEQRARFEQDNQARAALGLALAPMPHAFLSALEDGLPPSSGVALGLDRVLMLATGATSLAQIAPQSITHDTATGALRWG